MTLESMSEVEGGGVRSGPAMGKPRRGSSQLDGAQRQRQRQRRWERQRRTGNKGRALPVHLADTSPLRRPQGTAGRDR